MGEERLFRERARSFEKKREWEEEGKQKGGSGLRRVREKVVEGGEEKGTRKRWRDQRASSGRRCGG